MQWEGRNYYWGYGRNYYYLEAEGDATITMGGLYYYWGDGTTIEGRNYTDIQFNHPYHYTNSNNN